MAKQIPPSVARFNGFSPSGVAWFKALAYEQDREWFQAHRDGYETLWLNPMKALLVELEKPLGKAYGRKIGKPKIFRLNRDVRFAKDKSPYKTHIAAVVPFANHQPMAGPAALYLHLGLEEVVAFGFYFLEPPGLQRLRKGLLDERSGKAARQIVAAAGKKGLELDSMEQLKRAPPGVAPDHPRIDMLRHKGLGLSRTDIPKAVRHGPKLKEWIVGQAAAAAPLIEWGFRQRLLG